MEGTRSTPVYAPTSLGRSKTCCCVLKSGRHKEEIRIRGRIALIRIPLGAYMLPTKSVRHRRRKFYTTRNLRRFWRQPQHEKT